MSGATILTIGPATLIHDDNRNHMSRLAWVDAICSDPPYGIAYQVNARGPRGSGLDGVEATASARRAMIAGDDQPFDPSPWLGAPRIALCGADHFAQRLPTSGRWIVWDKRCGGPRDDHSDGEIVWLNRPGALRIHRQKWRGVVREGEENCSRSPKLHQNQKPVELMAYIMAELGLSKGQLVSDPYMGSGSTGVAALRRGLRFIGCEISAEHFATAVRRIRSEVGVPG